jgi:hypothetical protein
MNTSIICNKDAVMNAVFLNLYIHIYIYIFTYIDIYIYIYIYIGEQRDNENFPESMNNSIICNKDKVMTAVFLNFQSVSLFLMNSTLASNHAEYLSVNQSIERR